jgi:hypothetical protein
LAPATTAPLGSETVPRIVPRFTWPQIWSARAHNRTIKVSSFSNMGTHPPTGGNCTSKINALSKKFRKAHGQLVDALDLVHKAGINCIQYSEN